MLSTLSKQKPTDVPLSIITPVYNGERFIESCLQSVIQQEYPNVEHIIVDGQSSDGTLGIIERYAREYPHIQWISEADKGQSDAMNKGIRMARHDIISFLNCDDYYEPKILPRVAETFSHLPSPSFVAGNCNVWNHHGTLVFVSRPKRLQLEDLIIGWRIKPYRRLPVNPSSYFYHKEVHQIIGPYKLSEHYQMDIDFLLQVVQVAHLHYVDEVWGNMRFIEKTKSFSDRDKGLLYKKTGEMMEHYMSDLGTFSQWKVRFAWFLLEKWKRYLPES